MSTDFIAIGERIRGIREACDVTAEDMAADLDVDLETYIQWEETGADVPISAIYHMANRFGIEFTEILTGKSGHLDTFHLIKAGEGREVDRLPGYHFEDLAWRFTQKDFQPLLVTLDPHDEPAELVDHRGQEFNYILEGSIVFTFDDREIVLDAGDSIFFNPEHRHGQRCNGDVPASSSPSLANKTACLAHCLIS